jgi:hypothetical protein
MDDMTLGAVTQSFPPSTCDFSGVGCRMQQYGIEGAAAVGQMDVAESVQRNFRGESFGSIFR